MSLKRIFSVLISAALLVCALPVQAAAGFFLTLDGRAMTGFDADVLRYSETVEDVSELPILSAENAPTGTLVTQPSDRNDYTGSVSLPNGTVYTVRFHDDDSFQSHFINLGGDPWVCYVDGWYYYMVTGNGFYISRSRELERVNSNPVSVYTSAQLTADLGFSYSELWAPELHFIDGHWYIYVTLYDNSNTLISSKPKNHRMYVLRSETDDVYGRYTFMGQIEEVEADYIGDEVYQKENSEGEAHKPGHWAIDESVFEYNGKLYCIWSGWSGYVNVHQRIYIAEMDNPWTISSNRTMLATPRLAFETYTTSPSVNEGPTAIVSPDGRLNITYSVNSYTDPHYSLGLLTLKEGGDPLNAGDWVKSEEPVFSYSDNSGTYSVGHASFVTSPDGGEDYIIYHARRGWAYDNTTYRREIRVQRFYWNDDSTPRFGEPLSATDLVQNPSGQIQFERASFEAEDMELTGGAADSVNDALPFDADFYSGGKRVALKKAGDSATFLYRAAKAGTYTVSLLAAVCSTKSSSANGLSVSVNGGEPLTQKIGGTAGSTENYFYFDVEGLSLSEGENTITVSYTDSCSAGAYLDRVDVWSEEAYASAVETFEASERRSPEVIRVEKDTAPQTFTDGQEYALTSFDDFDKYWFSTTPFVTEYGDAITTCRPGGNKRLTAADPALKNVADFSATTQILPSAAHTVDTVAVAGETKVNAGILFRASDLGDGAASDCAFNGYRCMLLVGSDGTLKIQAHVYYYASDTDTTATGKVIATSAKGLPYTQGEPYVLSVSVRGSVLNAEAYNPNDPETTVEIVNADLYSVSAAPKFSCGQIGLFSNPAVGRVTFLSMRITPQASGASALCAYGNLNRLSAYTAYTQKDTYVFSESSGVLTIPTGVSKLMPGIDDADFTASARIRITNAKGIIQTGFCFRTQAVTTGSPGLTGYVLAIQRTTSYPTRQMTLNLTKYGQKGSAQNANIGSSPGSTTALLPDISAFTDAVGKEFLLEIALRGNMLTVKVTRTDNAAYTYENTWVLDSSEYTAMNSTYPVYYDEGEVGIFSNGVAQITQVRIDPVPEERYTVSGAGDHLRVFTDKADYAANETAQLTVTAQDGYYLKPTANGVTAIRQRLDVEQVLSVPVMGDAELPVTAAVILPGDVNTDEEVDVTDLAALKRVLAGAQTAAGFSNTDLHADGILTEEDYIALKKILLQ